MHWPLVLPPEAVAIKRRNPGIGLFRSPGPVAAQSGGPAGRPGRREGALGASQEAAGIYRKLATARPDAFRRALAMALTSLARRLGDMGRREEALGASQEAAGIYRELATRWPDTYRQELQHSLQVAAWLEHGE